MNPGFAGFRQGFIAFAQPSAFAQASAQPRQSALHYPPAGQRLKGATIRPSPDHGQQLTASGLGPEYRPAVHGIAFQPVPTLAGTPPSTPMDRETVAGVIHGIAGQTNGMFAESDFVPAPRSHPTCRSATYAYVEKREATPLPRVLEVGKYPDYITAGRMQGGCREPPRASARTAASGPLSVGAGCLRIRAGATAHLHGLHGSRGGVGG